MLFLTYRNTGCAACASPWKTLFRCFCYATRAWYPPFSHKCPPPELVLVPRNFPRKLTPRALLPISPSLQSAMFFRGLNTAVFYRWPEMATCFFIIFVIHILQNHTYDSMRITYQHPILVFLDGRKINLTEMVTFLVSLYRLTILLIQRSHDTTPENDHTGRLQFPYWKLMLNLNGKKAIGNCCD